MDNLYRSVAYNTSRLVTNRYSTSFSVGTRCLGATIRPAVYALYGFVRLADEIVDSFRDCDRATLLAELELDYALARTRGISINPVIDSFAHTVERYGIDDGLVDSFLTSMKMDLEPRTYDRRAFDTYVYGSAEVVGLMCLKIFVGGDNDLYQRLAPYAVRLGAAFQKVNFLRDLGADTVQLGRVYFPSLGAGGLDEETKKELLREIYDDFLFAEQGIGQLPRCARLGVYTAYLYYLSLTRAIEKTPAQVLMRQRVRVSNLRKALLLGKAWLSETLK